MSYSSTSTLTGGFQIVYNVTSDSAAFSGWTTLEVVGSNDNTNNGLYASLYASSRTTGGVTPLITASAGPVPPLQRPRLQAATTHLSGRAPERTARPTPLPLPERV